MSEFTKGRWEVLAGSSESNHCKRIFADTTLIAIVTNSDMTMCEIESNALLIASAPHLHESLEKLLETVKPIAERMPLSWRAIMDEAETALAKSRGEL